MSSDSENDLNLQNPYRYDPAWEEHHAKAPDVQGMQNYRLCRILVTLLWIQDAQKGNDSWIQIRNTTSYGSGSGFTHVGPVPPAPPPRKLIRVPFDTFNFVKGGPDAETSTDSDYEDEHGGMVELQLPDACICQKCRFVSKSYRMFLA